VPQSLTEAFPHSAEATVSESLYRMLFNGTKSLEHKLPSSRKINTSDRPTESTAVRNEPHSTLQDEETTIQGPDLFADDDDDY